MSTKGRTDKLKLPPQNIEAEQAVLGGILIDKNAIFKVADVLGPTDFYSPGHERIYSAVIELYEKHQPIDIVSVGNRLKENGTLKDVGGSSYLADLTNRVATSSHIAHYAQLVKEKRVLRDLIRVSGEVSEAAFDASQDIEDLLDAIEQKILAISQQSLPKNFVPLKEELKNAYERIEKLHQGGGKHRGVPTGFEGLDNLLSGLQKSDLVVIGARPSLGKTSLALDIARHAATREKIPVGFFSLEMSREQVIDRLVAAESQVSLWKILTGKISNDGEFRMIQEALDRLSQATIYIDDTPSLNIMQMRSMARRLQVEHGLGLIVVDYLQLITPRTSSDNVVQQVTEISRGLKALAREIQAPVLALSQLSRTVEQRGGAPRLSDLRESGAIEQDADVVMFIYRKDRDKLDAPPEEQNIAQINIAKHRNGPLGSVDLYFDAERTSFRQLEARFGEFLPANS